MAVNRNSGRVVVDVDPELKFALHAALAAGGLSMKEWFIQRAAEYVGEHRQPTLAFTNRARHGRSVGADAERNRGENP